MIRTSQLTKKYKDFIAVNSININVKRGEIFGLLGPNGAGKTTTIRMLTGIIKPSSGTAEIGGFDITKNPIQAKQIMGIVPEMANAYADLSALNNLLLMGELYGIPKAKRIAKARNLLKLFNLYNVRYKKVKNFSKGMKQRVVIAMAFMNNAKVFFLDEPSSGLDIESAIIIKKLIKKFNQKGATIFLTTHDMREADELCDRIAIINHGKIIATERPEILKNIMRKTKCITVAFQSQINTQDIKPNSAIQNIKKQGDKIVIYGENTENIIEHIIKYARSTNNKIISLNTVSPSLEDIFIKLIKR